MPRSWVWGPLRPGLLDASPAVGDRWPGGCQRAPAPDRARLPLLEPEFSPNWAPAGRVGNDYMTDNRPSPINLRPTRFGRNARRRPPQRSPGQGRVRMAPQIPAPWPCAPGGAQPAPWRPTPRRSAQPRRSAPPPPQRPTRTAVPTLRRSAQPAPFIAAVSPRTGRDQATAKPPTTTCTRPAPTPARRTLTAPPRTSHSPGGGNR